MKDAADVVIIGAGIMGLSIAYNLAKRHGVRNVVVLDQTYLCGGASGRNGGGVRAQWSTEANVRLMRESLQLCREFAREHRINTWFRQGGYLFLVRDDERAKALAEEREAPEPVRPRHELARAQAGHGSGAPDRHRRAARRELQRR